MYIYYDTESDYLEIRFGEPTQAHYDKIGEDTYERVDEKTGDKKGYAIYNVKKGTSPIKSIEVDIPLHLFKTLKSKQVYN